MAKRSVAKLKLSSSIIVFFTVAVQQLPSLKCNLKEIYVVNKPLRHNPFLNERNTRNDSSLSLNKEKYSKCIYDELYKVPYSWMDRAQQTTEEGVVKLSKGAFDILTCVSPLALLNAG